VLFVWLLDKRRFELIKRSKMGRPKLPEDERRKYRQNFRLNKDEYKILKSVPGKSLTVKWCYLLKLWDKNK